MVSNRVPRQWTLDEYLAYELETQIKHEYIDGEIYAMSGGTKKHSLIATNCIAELSVQLRGSPCRVHSSDMRIKIDEMKYVYPDFSVVCGEGTFADENETMLIDPVLVCEVLSPSSMDYDRGMKGDYYRSLSSLRAYLMIDQSRVFAQLYTLQDKGWLLQEFHSHKQVIPLDVMGVSLPLSEVYRGIKFEL